MKKIGKRLIALSVCAVLLLQFGGCGKKEANNGNANTKIKGVSVWSAPSTVKVQQDDVDYEDKRPAELTYNAVRNEYESQQLFITASKQIDSYDLKIEDLKNGEHVFSKENIDVYNERFTYITETYYSDGYYPDALIPLEAAKEAGDLKIAKNNNAGLWITIYVPKDTPAGTYTGTFQLVVGGKSLDIPVEVKVNDYTLTDDINTKTIFSWRYQRTGVGELDSSVEMMEAYYEFFLDYRISLQTLPMESLNGEELVACLEKYYDRLSTYCIGNVVGNISTTLPNAKNRDIFREQVFAIAEICTPEKNYLDKAMLYVIDEPDLQNEVMTREYMFDNYETMTTWLTEIADDIAKDNTGKYAGLKQIENWRSYIVDMPNIVPVSSSYMVDHPYDMHSPRAWETFNCVCPHWHHLTEEVLEYIYDLCEEYDTELWWYGSMWPVAPGANYHIGNTNLLSARSITWLQKKLNVQGNLYWDAVSYSQEEIAEDKNEFVDMYTQPYQHSGMPAGDGKLTYAGASYDLYGPLPSVRLMSIRDGSEEYEMLLDIENGYKVLAEKYGNSISVSELMEPFYTSLYDGNWTMYSEGEYGLDFDKLRASLIDAAVWAGKGIDFALNIGGINNNIASIDYYVSENCTVYIADEKQTPIENGHYQYSLNLAKETTLKLVLETEDGTQYETSRFISNPTYTLQAMSEDSVLNKITVTEGSKMELVESKEYSTDGTSVLCTVNGVITGNALADSVYIPSVSLDVKMLEGISNITDMSSVLMDVYNPGEEFTCIVRIYSGAAFVEIGEVTLANGKNVLNLDIANAEFSDMANADQISFEFTNSEDGKTPNSYQFYIDNVYGKK